MSAVHLPPADIPLDPADWYVASWRNLPPLPRPAPTDREDCLARLAAVKVGRSGWDWSSARIGPCLGVEEGRFWLEAFTRARHRNAKPAQIAEELRDFWPSGRLSRRLCEAHLGHSNTPRIPEFVSALASQLELPVLVEVLFDRLNLKASYRRRPFASIDHSAEEMLVDGFRHFVRPYLDSAALESARQVLRDDLSQPRRPEPTSGLPDFVVSLMASLGMTEEVTTILSSWHPRFSAGFEESGERPFAVFGLPDPSRVIPELRRLRLRLSKARQVRGLLAHLEAEAVPFLRDAIIDCPNRPEAEPLTTALGLVLRPETAVAMLALTQKSRAPAPAQRWLDEHRELAIPGVLPLIGDAALGEPALSYLRNQVRLGHQVLIDSHVAQLDPVSAARVRRGLETTTAMQTVDDVAVPTWFPPAEGEPRLPVWLDPTTLPPLRIDGRRLPVLQVTTLLARLREATLTDPPALFAQIRKQAEPRLLDAFAWAVFERWHSASADPRDKWALTTLGHLGGDGVCLPLAALIGEWPGKSQHQRASHGLSCLEAIGTPLALTCIHRLAQKSHYDALRLEADAMIERLAHGARTSLASFEDRIVPDLGLDADGYRRFPYSGQAYRLALGPDREARLLDHKRQYLTELPDFSDQDDPAEVEAARAEWTLFRQQVREVVLIQNERLLEAMLRWRRWSAADFQTYLVRHPLLGHLTRALLWGVFASISKLHLTFRVTEGRTCVDAAGTPVALDPKWPIGVVHPILLRADERMIWADVLSEQGVDLPDWQMPRVTWPLEESEKDQRELSRWKGHPLDFHALQGASRSLGYESGARQREHFCCRVQYYSALKQTVYLLHTPIPADASYEAQQVPIELTGCQIRPGDTRTRVPNVKEALPLGKVDPVLLDEVIGGMTAVTRTAAKAVAPGR